MIRILHASDLHLGKPFGTFPEDVRNRLRQARQDCIGVLADAARGGMATHILLAGDTFDAETPARTTLRHAMNAMAAADDLTWVLMPGNHDHLKASEIWSVLAREAPGNVTLALDPAPLPLTGHATLLPAPCTVRAPGRDLTDWMDAADTGDAIRIGLAHGSIRDFRPAEEIGADRGTYSGADGGAAPAEFGGEGSPVIAPDRAARAHLDYLGFGDWHGRIEVSPGTWYSGTPEPDSFKPHRPAGALLVEIAAPGAAANVREVETGRIGWHRLALDLLDGEDAAARLRSLLPDLSRRDRSLVDIAATGRASLAVRAALEQAVHAVAPDFLWADHDLSALSLTRDLTDLAEIDARGAVRDAADALAEAADAGDTIAAAALSRLYSYALEEA